MGERRFTDPMRWRRDLTLVAALILAILAFVREGSQEESGEIREVVERVEQEAEKSRNASIQNCRDLRVVEYALIDAEQEGIKDDRALPASFFSDIPPAKFRKLVREGIGRAHQTIRELRPNKTCAERFD